MSEAADLRARAEALGETLPPLLAEAEHLAAWRSAADAGPWWQFRTGPV